MFPPVPSFYTEMQNKGGAIFLQTPKVSEASEVLEPWLTMDGYVKSFLKGGKAVGSGKGGGKPAKAKNTIKGK